MIRTLLVATTNPGKVREIRLVLSDVPVELLTLGDLPPVPEPAEDGATFADNARMKATAYARATGHVTAAEDSGLVIDALGGRPGVASARYPGETYADKFAGLYRELASRPRPWTARFVCSVAVVDPAGADPTGVVPVLFACEAAVEGEIASAPRGSQGFGYDPIFWYSPDASTFGELPPQRKLAVAHRGQAFRQVRDWLRG